MDVGGEGVSVYAEAKGEYTKQLCQYMVPALQKYFLELLEEAKQKDTDPKKLLISFQALLEAIAEWNLDKVQRETGQLSTATGCDYLEELLTAVFIAHTKVLSAIRLTTKQKKLQITIPKLDHFLHRTLTECARLLWSNTYLFSTTAPSMERQKNLRQIESLLHDGVLQSIRSMLPVKNILREYLKDDSDNEEEEEEEEEKEKEKEKEEKETEDSEKKSETPTPPTASSISDENDSSDSSPPSSNILDVSSAQVPIFTGIDTLFNELSENGVEDDKEAEKEDIEEDENEDIQIVDAPPEPMDDFEDLEKPEASKEEDILPMDFEELS
jgi:hypothetical protein